MRTVAALADGGLADGARLHLATDRRFHGHPAFREATAEASALLRAAPFTQPPHRIFFLAHVFVEIALDGRLLANHPGIADDLYGHLEAYGAEAIAAATPSLLGRSTTLPNLAATVVGFLSARYLPTYASPSGQAAALHRIGLMAGLTGFPNTTDRSVLSGAFAEFAPRLAAWEDDLLTPPAGLHGG
jgi:hypothetical protein